MTNMRQFRAKASKPAPKTGKFAGWADRAYFLAGYISGLVALGLILFTVIAKLAPDVTEATREHKGWDLSQPRELEKRTLGQ